MELTETEKAWMAGFLDADGMVTIHKHSTKNGYQLMVTVASTDKNVAQTFENCFDGHTTIEDDIYYRNLPLYHYTICANKAYNLLQILLPYLRTKHDRAKVGMKLQERINAYREARKHIWTEEERQARHKLYLEMKSLIAEGNTRTGRYSKSKAEQLGKPRG